MRYNFQKAAQDNGFTGAVTYDETKNEGMGVVSSLDPEWIPEPPEF
tara:strand:+ start:3878 stop:4015 length:138 start_codon:yes stop_codon:yes gene_type:complete